MIEVQNNFYLLFISILAILAVINPFGNLPQYLEMTEDIPVATRQKLFRTIIYTAFIIVLIFTLAGPYIMKYLFKIEIRDLRMAGGVILIVMGIKNLLFPLKLKYKSPDTTSVESEKEIIRKCIIPMAFPMMVGPGTLATLIVMSSDSGMFLTILSAAVSFLVMLILFHFSASLEKLFGKLVLLVVARIMQVFIVAMGVKMFMMGLKDSINFLVS